MPSTSELAMNKALERAVFWERGFALTAPFHFAAMSAGGGLAVLVMRPTKRLRSLSRSFVS
eukprot:4757416-Alexandrium_andersonii.AAC.1